MNRRRRNTILDLGPVVIPGVIQCDISRSQISVTSFKRVNMKLYSCHRHTQSHTTTVGATPQHQDGTSSSTSLHTFFIIVVTIFVHRAPTFWLLPNRHNKPFDQTSVVLTHQHPSNLTAVVPLVFPTSPLQCRYAPTTSIRSRLCAWRIKPSTSSIRHCLNGDN